jgi:hypothetical protein
MSFFPFCIHSGSYLDKDEYVYFQNTLIHTYIKEKGTSVAADYFCFKNLDSVKKLGVSQIQLSESMFINAVYLSSKIFFFLDTTNV